MPNRRPSAGGVSVPSDSTTMILLPIFLGLVCAVLVNGLADNLTREEEPAPFASLVPRCSYCDSPRKARDLSAVASNLFFGGRCLRCGAPRPFRDLLVESILLAGFPVIWLTGRTAANEFMIGGLILAAFLLFTVVDFEHRLVAVEAVGLVSLLLIVDAWFLGTNRLLAVLEGGLAGFAVFLILFFLGKILAFLFRLGEGTEPLGFGDVLLAALVGFAVGWPAVLLAMFVSIFLGGLIGVVLLAASSLRNNPLQTATMAYGPYLLIAGMLVYFYGGPFLGGLLNIASGF
jgi:prepilin signal peptidase PulO-like enzyme (type II secretory pathway)